MTQSTAGQARPAEPFRGIEEFRFVDQLIFPSRADEVRRLLRLITLYRGVLLYGDSGVGKSSLINAGLLPKAIEEGFAPERLRVDPRPGAEIIVERISLTDKGEAPYLPSRFARNEKQRRITLSLGDFRSKVEAFEYTTDSYPLLIFDQFEELLTLGEPRPGERDSSRETQENIVRVLFGILAKPTIPVKILFVFREDFLAKLAKFFARHPNLSDQYLRLDPLPLKELPKIIRTPFERVDFGKRLPNDVIAKLDEQLRLRRDADFLNLSEVQIAALRLWQSPEPMALLEKRGVGGLIEDYFSEAIDRLGTLKEPAMLLLHRMVTSAETRNVISRDDLVESVAKTDKIPAGQLVNALKELEKGRVIRGERRSKVIVYEIVSEYLVPWIARKRAELAAEKRRKEYLERETAAYRKYLEEREEKRWNRRLRINQAVVVMALLITVAYYIYGQLTSNQNLIEELAKAKDETARLQDQREMDTQTIDHLRKELTDAKSKQVTQTRENDRLKGLLEGTQTLATQCQTDLQTLARRATGLQNDLQRCRASSAVTQTAPVTTTSTAQ